MPVLSPNLDTPNWRRIRDPRYRTMQVDFEYCLLGYDMKAQRVDFLMRFGDRGTSRWHRHRGSTATFVLEGEHHVVEILPDGSSRETVHGKGAYVLMPGDSNLHLEHGGPNGAVVLMTVQCIDGALFEFFDDDFQNARTMTLQEGVSEWMRGMIFGAAEPPSEGIDSYRLRYRPGNCIQG